MSIPQSLTVEVESPVTADDHVTAVHIFAERNPLPHVGKMTFTSRSGEAGATRTALTW